MAKIAFSRLDINNDGSITEHEARKVFDEYFSRLNISDGYVYIESQCYLLLVCSLICLFLDMVDLYWRRKNTGSETYAKHALERAMSLDVKEMGSVWAIFNRHLLVLFNC